MKKHIYYTLALALCLQPVTSQAATTITPFVDALVWTASEQNASNWALVISPAGTTRSVTPATMTFNYKPGIKAGIQLAPDNFWDTTLSWTYFSTSTTNTYPLGPSTIFSTMFSGNPFSTLGIYYSAYIDWQLVMNMGDLQVSHAFKPTPTLTFTPQIGIKGGTINQTLHSTWDAVIYVSHEYVSHNFTGIGPSFGLASKWNFYDDFSLEGDISTALMYGKWNVTDIFRRPVVLFVPAFTYATSMTNARLGTYMMDYYLGLEYSHKGKSQVTFKLGYEMQYWANQLRLTAFQQLPTHGDLTIQGATCGIYLDL